MSFFQFVTVRLCIYLIAGILLGRLLSLPILLALALVLVAFLQLTVVYALPAKKAPIGFGVATYCVILCVGILAESLNNPLNYPDYFGADQIKKEKPFVIQIREELKPSPFSLRYLAEVRLRGSHLTSGDVLLEISPRPDTLVLEVDNLVWVWGSSEKVAPPLYPGAFNYSKYLRNKGIFQRLRIKPKAVLKITPGKTSIKGIAARVRAKLRQGFSTSYLGSREAGVLQALLLGYRYDLSEETYNAYKTSGAVHILAVSGLHVGMLLAFLRVVFRPVSRWDNGRPYLVLQLVSLWAFAFITGFSPSVIRAVTMGSFLAYALYINRPSNSFNILALSILFILLCLDPNLLFQVGFQMSYAAVIGILWIYPIIRSICKPKHRISRWVVEMLSVSIAAQAGVLPISLLYFHQFPILFFLTNLMVIPILGIVLGGGMIIMVWMLFSAVPHLIMALYEKLLWLMNEIVYTIAGFESFTLTSIKFDVPALILSYLIIFGMVNFFKTGRPRTVFLGLTAVIMLQGYWIGVLHFNSGKEQFIIFHRFSQSVIVERKGLQLFLRAPKVNDLDWLGDFVRDEGILKTHFIPLDHGYRFYGKHIFILDSLSQFPIANYRPDILVVTYSPRVNPDRILEGYKPGLVVLDGSNYSSIASYWRQSCKSRKIPFHNTAESGAYILNN